MRHGVRIAAGLLLALWVAGPALAGRLPDRPGLERLRGSRVVDVRIEGAGLSETEARGYVEVRAGDRFSLRAVRKSVKLLYHLGLFGQVRVQAAPAQGGVVLIFELVPKRRVLAIEFHGNQVLTDAELRRLSRMRRGQEFDRWKMEAAAIEMRTVYARKGYRRTRVVSRAEGPEHGDVTVHHYIQEGPPTRISRIWWKADPAFAPRRLEEVLELERGDVLDQDELEKGIERLRRFYRRHQYLEAEIEPPRVEPELQALFEVVTIEIQAGPRVDFEFEGNAVLAERQLTAALGLDDHKGKLDQFALRDLADRLEDLYRRHGYARVGVEPAARLDPARNRKTLLFRIEEGPRVTVRDIRFEGNRAFGDEKLRAYIHNAMLDAISQQLVGQPVDRGDMDALGGGHPLRGVPRRVNRPQGFLFELVPETIFLRKPYELALEQIADLYRSGGYLDVRVGTPLLSFGAGGANLYITIPIEEGPRTEVESITFSGNQRIQASELVQVADQHTGLVRPGAPLNLYGVEELRKELVRTYAGRGFVYCRVEQKMRFSTDRGLAEVHYHIEEGPQVRVARVLVRGNVVTDQAVFDHLVQLRPGSLYAPQSVSASQNDLLALGVFSGVDIKMLDPDVPEARKNVVVTVRERLPHSFTFGPGLSSGEGVRLELDYTQRNLFGYALELVSRAKVNYQVFYPLLPGDLRDRYQRLGFLEGLEGWVVAGLHWPRLWFLRRDVAARVDLVGLQDHALSHDLTKVSLVPGVDFKFTRDLALTVEYEIEYDYLSCPPGQQCGGAAAEKWIRYDEGSLLLGALRPELSFDRRDNIFWPHRGIFLALRTELANNFLRNREVLYFKLDTLVSGYVPLGRETTLALSVRGGAIFHLTGDSRTPAHKRFWLGGRNTVRGYPEEGLLPADQVNPEDPGSPCVPETDREGEERCISLGGNAYVVLKAEIRTPLVPGTVEGALFVDAGNLWLDPAHFDPFTLRPAAGFGLRFVTPIGPVAFDFGFNLDPDEDRREPLWNLHFNIGMF